MKGIYMAPVVYISVDWDYCIVLPCCFIHFINKENKVDLLIFFWSYVGQRQIMVLI